MPSKKKKYNARFPPARIKKIMQSDEEVGKVAQAVPVIISRALELFVESLLKKAEIVTQQRNAKTLTPSHLKQCIMSEQRFDFLRDLVSTISDIHDEDSPEGTPRASTSESTFVFQAPPGSSSSSSSTSVAGPSSSSTPSATSTSSDFYQNPPQNPNSSSEMSEFMMSLPNYLNVKHEDIKSNQQEQAYSIQQHSHHQQQQQQQTVPHYQPSYQHHQQQQQQQHHHSASSSSSSSMSNPPAYIPAHQSSSQQQQHQEHINPTYSHYYSQFEQSANGKLKLETHNNPMSNYPQSSSSSLGAHRSSYPPEQHHGSYEHYYDKPNEGYLSEPRHHNNY